MGLLDGLVKAGLVGTASYMQGQDAGRQRRQAEQVAAEARRREAEMDALRRRLLEINIRSAETPGPTKWQAEGFETPEAWHEFELTRTGRNGSPTYDPASDVQTRREEYYRRHNLGRYAPPKESASGSRGTSKSIQDDEAEGIAIMNTKHQPQVKQMLEAGFRAARQNGNTMSPGRLVKQLYEGIRRARPDLFRAAPAQSREDRIASRVLGNAPQAAPQAAPEGAVDAPMTPDEIAQFRALVDGLPNPAAALADAGLDPDDIRQVLGQ